jgi:ABC-type dipeptide/oligopeptide/nickel transport system ATPase component
LCREKSFSSKGDGFATAVDGFPFHPRCPQKFDGCDRIEPQLGTVKDAHQVACHLY